jgi:hypothetical protein
MAREQLKADSCKVKVERWVQDMHDNSAASSVAFMAKRRAGILAKETASAAANKKPRLPVNSNAASSSRISTKAKTAEVQTAVKQLQTTARSPSFKAAFLHSLQEFASVTECSSFPATATSISSTKIAPTTISIPESVYGSHLQSQSTISSEGDTNTLPTYACSDPGSNRSSLSSNGSSLDMIVSCYKGNPPSSLINRVVSDDSTAIGKDQQPNHRNEDHGMDKSRNISRWNTNSEFILHASDPSFGASNLANTNASANLPRGITLRPSGKWQAQLYFAGQSRYIGVFDSRERAVLAYEIVREKVKDEPDNKVCSCPLMAKEIFDLARQAAFAGVQSITHS